MIEYHSIVSFDRYVCPTNQVSVKLFRKRTKSRNFSTFSNRLTHLIQQIPTKIKHLFVFNSILVSDYAGKNSIVAGWGMISESNKTSCTLQAVRVPIMSNADCFENTNYKNVSDIFAVDNMMCAGYPEGAYF